MQIVKEILKVALLSILLILLVIIFNIDFTVINHNIAGLFISMYWFFAILMMHFFIYIVIYLMIIFYLFKNKMILFNYIFVLLFTISFYLLANFFTARNERIDDILRSVLIILSCSGLTYYLFKIWIKR